MGVPKIREVSQELICPSPASQCIMSYEETQRYLYGLKYHGAKYGIDRIQVFAEALGHPERAYPVVHVAGTNGKGSVCAMLEAIFRQGAYRTGLFTSPHLVFLGERIQVNRQPLSPDDITRQVAHLREVAEARCGVGGEEHPSFFEFMTGMAFDHFREQAVDVGIIETGLGGRLDATNVVQPQMTIITSIGLDHQQQLGDTLEQIAAEKAGILKPGVPVVLGWLPPVAEAVIRQVAAERNCPVHSVREAFGPDVNNYPVTCLEGDYQRINAAVATLAARLLRDLLPVDDACIAEALHEVSWAGRWQRLSLDCGRTLILDASHNEEGACMLEGNLRRLVEETGQQPVVMAGALGKCRAEALFRVVCRYARELILLVPNQPRASRFAELREAIPADFTGVVRESRVDELFPLAGACAVGEPGDVILSTGSIYLIGEICTRFFPSPFAGESMLQDVI